MRPLQQRPWLLPAATAALAVLALGAAAIARWRLGCSFTEVSPGSGVFRCVQPYLSVALAPVLIRVDKTKGLLLKKRVPHWVLVDAGFRDSWALGPYVSALTRAVQRRLAAAPTAGSLDLIVLTHAHPDHTGALAQLLALYPDAKVVTHVAEMRFVAGEAPASHFEGPRPGPAQLTRVINFLAGRPAGVPKDHLLHVHGEDGDLATALHSSAGAMGRDHKGGLKWLPKGALRFIHTPGHTPGHMSLLHVPSKTLLPGDTVVPWLGVLSPLGWLGWAHPAGLRAPLEAVSHCHDSVEPQAKRLLEQEDYKLVLPYHGGAFTREQALAAVAGWPAEPLDCPHPAPSISGGEHAARSTAAEEKGKGEGLGAPGEGGGVAAE